MGTRNDKTAAGLRVARGSQGCFKTISRDSLRSHGPERGAVVRRSVLSRDARRQRGLNRPEGLRGRGAEERRGGEAEGQGGGGAEQRRSGGAEEQRGGG